MLFQYALCAAVALVGVQSAKPNIVWIWFDDLGLGDVGFMGGDMPTPILDNLLAAAPSVKLNFHYTDGLSTPSRAAFLTGKYGFKSGINTRVWSFSKNGFNTNNKLVSDILKDADYNNLIAGKWAMGHDVEERLPHENGFSAGLYQRVGGAYYDLQFRTETIENMDAEFGPLTDQTLKDARDALFPLDPESNTRPIKMQRLYRLSKNANGKGKEEAAEVDAAEYIEDLSYNEIAGFLEEQDTSKPFFMYYSIFSPHNAGAESTQPPSERNGAAVDYSVCSDAFGDATTGECGSRCIYCKQIHYSSLIIQDIVDSISSNADMWDNTVIVISSDCGPSTGRPQGIPGSAMPLKGRKGGVFEGALRTAAVMLGGKVQEFTDQQCEYNEMVHISDWYHIFMDMLKEETAVSDDYQPDSDHEGLGIFDNIKCQCAATDDAQKAECNADPDKKPRTELVTMVSCNHGEDDAFFHNTAVIKDGYKLIVNGASGGGARSFCGPIQTRASGLTQYHGPPSSLYRTPTQAYYDAWYKTIRARLGVDKFNTLYRSSCLENLYEPVDPATVPADFNEAAYGPFQYAPDLLYNLADDKVEACALDLAEYEEVYLGLKVQLISAALQYDAPDSAVERYEYEAFQFMMQEFDCEEPGDGSFVLPSQWNEDDSEAPIDYDTLWQNYIDEYGSCDESD